MKPATTFNCLMGQVVLHRRKSCAATQTMVAEMLGLSQSAYSRLERGQTPFTVPQLKKVAKALSTPMESFILDADRTAEKLADIGVQVLLDHDESDVRRWLWVSEDVVADAVTTSLLKARTSRRRSSPPKSAHAG